MTRAWITLALGAAVLLPGAARAQDSEVAIYTVGGRPRIGVTVNMNAGAANDKIGATISSVTPDGPAAKAGLEAGDIITKFNGTSLAGGDNPGEWLVELAHGLDAGDTVKVDYRRGTANRSATIIAADLGMLYSWSDQGVNEKVFELAPYMNERARAMADRELAFVDMERAMEGMGGPYSIRLRGGAFGLDLAEMNPGLGEYFGTSSGVLVLKTPSDSTMPLKAGDVIVAIDGRDPASVGQARRILASYDTGDVAKFEIMRMKKKLTVSWTVPAATRMKLPGGVRWRSGSAPKAKVTPGAAPRVRVRVAPSAPGVPATPAAEPAPRAAPMPPPAAPAVTQIQT